MPVDGGKTRVDSVSSLDVEDGLDPCDGMIFVMGVTGTGKSYFINKVVAGAVEEHDGLASGTKTCQVVQVRFLDGTTIALVDTPGFDDSDRDDAAILREITTYLASQYRLRIPLKGIIYCHDITDSKMRGSSIHEFEIFQKLCGEDAFENIILLTTKWSELTSRSKGEDRERELRNNYWKVMRSKGSSIASFDGSVGMAQALVAELASKKGVVLDIQREVVESDMTLGDTSAGKIVSWHLERRVRQIAEELQRARDQRESVGEIARIQAKKERHEEFLLRLCIEKLPDEASPAILELKEKRKWSPNKALKLFCSITGLVVSVIFNVLPVFGVNV